MDGNGRWAQARMQPRVFGHRAGVKAVRETVEHVARAGASALTLFAFSSENWSRPHEEVEGLMELFLKAIRQEAQSLLKDGVALRFIGDLERFSNPLRAEMSDIVTLTAGNDRLRLNVAVNYGGRWDIANAAKRIATDVRDGYLSIDAITEQSFNAYTQLADLPPIDLFIRTGGETRVSNFLLWQIAYAELYFSKVLWPDFDQTELQLALADYASRQRRFGKTGEQVEGAHGI